MHFNVHGPGIGVAETSGLATVLAQCSAVIEPLLKLASEVTEENTTAFDVAILRWLRDVTAGDTPLKDWMRNFMRDITALGENSILTMVAVICW